MTLGASVVMVEDIVAQKSKNEIYVVYNVMMGTVKDMEQEFS